MKKRIYVKDAIGKKFGKLLILSESNLLNGKSTVLCLCDCGNKKVIRLGNIIKGDTVSCGCYARSNKSNFKHGLRNHRLYEIWAGMKKRCYNKNCNSYKDYGGRGIEIYPAWISDFKCFYEWAIKNGYSDILTIERKDYNANYDPDNCTFISNKDQCLNKRDVLGIKRVREIRIQKANNPSLTIKKLALLHGVCNHTISDILHYKTYSNI
jgi:hypothetical protein